MRLLIVDDIHEVFLEKMQVAGIQADYRPDMELEEARQVIPGYDGLVIRSQFRVTRDFMEHAPGLRFIARGGAGMDNIDEIYAGEKGIALLNAPEGNRNAVAEHMTGMLLALMNKLHAGHQEIQQGKWQREENRGLELRGRTVALIGYGNNGQAMAQCLAGFGVRIMAYDKYKTGFGDERVIETDMDEIYRQADVLSLHTPLTAETHQLINGAFLERFQNPIFFLNGARGEIVEIPAVLAGLRAGSILGAAFDVLPVEQFPTLGRQDWFEDLIHHPRVLLSPHVAGWTVESYFKIANVLADKIIEVAGAVKS